MDWGAVIESGASILSDVIGGSGGDDRMQTYQARVFPAASQAAKQYNLPVFAFWFGSVIGVNPQGQIFGIGSAASGSQADSMVANWAKQQNTDAIMITSLSPFAMKTIDTLGYISTTPSTISIASGTTGVASQSAQPAAGGLEWLAIAGIGLAAYLFLRKHK